MEIHGKVSTSQSISGKTSATSAVTGDIDNEIKDRIYRDYNLLKNKPSIEGEELIGDKKLTDFGIPYVFYGTVAEWNSQPSLIGIKDAVYVYLDYDQDDDGHHIPGIKIGDGLAYLIDTPFTSSNLYDHIRNTVVHITSEERDAWNNKVRCCIDSNNLENLIFTTN